MYSHVWFNAKSCDRMWSHLITCENSRSKSTCEFIFTCENSHDFTCENSHLKIHMLTFTSFYIWKLHNFTCKNSHVNVYSRVNIHIIVHVKIHMWMYIHVWTFTWLYMWKFTCECIFTCEHSHDCTCENSRANFHIISYMKIAWFHMWRFKCSKFTCEFHTCEFMWNFCKREIQLEPYS